MVSHLELEQMAVREGGGGPGACNRDAAEKGGDGLRGHPCLHSFASCDTISSPIDRGDSPAGTRLISRGARSSLLARLLPFVPAPSVVTRGDPSPATACGRVLAAARNGCLIERSCAASACIDGSSSGVPDRTRRTWRAGGAERCTNRGDLIRRTGSIARASTRSRRNARHSEAGSSQVRESRVMPLYAQGLSAPLELLG